MPRLPQYAHCKTQLFAHPNRGAAGVLTTASLALVLPTSFELIPLGNRKRHAKDKLNMAKSNRDVAYRDYIAAMSSWREAEQRIVDLDCAMSGYPQFNQQITAFQSAIDSSALGPMEQLKAFWQVYFTPDKSTTEQSVQAKTWYDTEYVYDYYYSCSDHTCSDDKKCCTDWGYHYVTTTAYFNEVTTISAHYAGIIEGSAIHLPPMDCGYYSRQFKTSAPQTFLKNESPHTLSGDRRAGAVYINFSRDFRSKMTADYVLDSATLQFESEVVATTYQNDAAKILNVQLLQFLATAIAAFNLTGANYGALQTSIRASLPGLASTASALNDTLNGCEEILKLRTAEFNEVDQEFKHSLSIWLPILFLVPGALALFSYLFLTHFQEKAEAQPRPQQNDLEANLIVELANQSNPQSPLSPPLSERDCAIELPIVPGGPNIADMERPPAYAPGAFKPAPSDSTDELDDEMKDQAEGQPHYLLSLRH
jgi:hypothetical protein